MRIRTCHVTGQFQTSDNIRPAFSRREALETPRRDVSRIVLPPASFVHEKEKIEKRWPAAQAYIAANAMNEFFDGDVSDIGIVMQGGMYNTTLRALELNGLADAFGHSRIPLYVLNVTYPLVDAELQRFASGKRAILVVEEGAPEYIEQAISTMLRRADIQTRVHGKDVLPMAGDYTGAVLQQGFAKFVETYHAGMVPVAGQKAGDNRGKAALAAAARSGRFSPR